MNKRNQKPERILLFTVYWLLVTGYFLTGCATRGYVPPPKETRATAGIHPAKPLVSYGIYHRVEKGQTLWRIAKTYNVDMEKIVKVNRIPNIANIEVGQLIFIPGVMESLNIESMDMQKEKTDFIWPVKGKLISSFGSRYGNTTNKGVDIQTEIGADVFAARNGKVAFCGNNLRGYGKTIIIDHGDGFSTIYACNSQILVKVGEEILQNKLIAKVGTTSRDKLPLLHFEIRKGHRPQNPLYYLP